MDIFKKSKYKIIINSTACFFIVLIMLMFLLWIKEYAPFGNNSFAWMDGNIQYMDFFTYLKDVFEGKNSIGYTLSNMLGGSSIGVLGYYLSSPLNLIIIFFSKTNIPTFFNILVLLKLSIAGFTFSYYLQKRFDNKIKPIYIILLSICYALMQYTIAQASNIMWLDGVYMLPLILLGVYRVVNNKSLKLLSFTIGLSIIFNWYTGGINCLFSIFWFIVEELLYNVENKRIIKEKLKEFVKDGFKYFIAMIIGVMISAVLFLPNVFILKQGRGNSFDWESLKNQFNGNIISVIHNYSLGAVSKQEALSIFCGTIPLIGCIQFFVSKLHTSKKKIILGMTLCIAILFCYWQPFCFIFSLLKMPLSYFFRYSYIVIFTFIFIAANYYKNIDKETNQKIILSACIFSFLLLLINYVKPDYTDKQIYYTIFFVITISVIVSIYLKYKEKIKWKKIISVGLLAVVMVEMLYNTRLLMNTYQYSEVNQFSSYQEAQQRQIDEIKQYDKGEYRISQTTTRNTDQTNLTLNYNEALAFHYMSSVSYTSTPDNNQLEFLNNLGYRTEGGNTSIINTSIIGADALLGVKYVLSPYDIKGLQKIDSIKDVNGKSVYRNPYALDMSFVSKYNNFTEILTTNSFDFQNKLYSFLAGRNVEIYKKINFEKIESDDKKSVKYDIIIPDGNYTLYGNLPWSEIANEIINVNDTYTTAYACSTSPSVFYIPYEGNVAFIEVSSESQVSIADEQFYILDLNLLEEVTKEINANKTSQLNIENNEITCKVQGKKDERVILLMAYSNGMTIWRNDEKMETKQIENCFITIPLVEGENNIKIKYDIPGLKIGAMITGLGIIALLTCMVLEKSKKRRKELKNEKN